MTGEAGETFMTWTFSDVMCTSISNSGNQESAETSSRYSFQAAR